ncbi:TPA: helix-turn-helix transcriptional regulator [Streptococcus suis]|nr:helix-turn-helix transcriptional regulator [Streptococcus suis]
MVFENRKQYGYSQQELANVTVINRAMISRIEKGNYLPSIPN